MPPRKLPWVLTPPRSAPGFNRGEGNTVLTRHIDTKAALAVTIRAAASGHGLRPEATDEADGAVTTRGRHRLATRREPC